MSIKIDPETQKAVEPESIGKNDFKRLILCLVLIAVGGLWAYVTKYQ